MFTWWKNPGPLETEIKELKHEIETLKRENAQLRDEKNKLKESLDEAVRHSRPQPAPRGLKPSNAQLPSDSELQRKLNETDEQLNRTINQLSETRKQLSDVQSRLTVNERVTAATQRRELIQEGVYQNLPTNSVYEELRFDPLQEHLYAELQPIQPIQPAVHRGCTIIFI